MCKFKTLATAAAVALTANTSFAAGHANSWTLDGSLSNVSFGSIKNDYIGESHSFGDVSGTVSVEGAVEITLGLASVETMIDIRNERLGEFVFQNALSATLTAALEMDALNALETGGATTVEAYGTLNHLGLDTDVDATFFVMRLTDSQVLVTTNGMAMLSTEDAGLDDGIDKLQELANLDSITRVSPVTMRLVFNAD
ncbi:MAG: YceI family protein [Paracoccaceae bacterium]|nr:YceI family protein [Paracoccaceae bacterium]